MISISGKEAKKHIQAALKAVFPGVRFSLQSTYDSVTVSWTDGPVVPHVEKVLNRFVSYTRILDVCDRHEATGYEWEGEVYVGPRYLSATRVLSHERRTIIEHFMSVNGMPPYTDAKVFERVDAELKMIEVGWLDGVLPADRPDLMRDERPVIDRRKPRTPEAPRLSVVPPADPQLPKAPARLPASGKVVPLRPYLKQPEDPRLNDLTPVQRLKLAALEVLTGRELVEQVLEREQSIDVIFAELANLIFKEGGENDE